MSISPCDAMKWGSGVGDGMGVAVGLGVKEGVGTTSAVGAVSEVLPQATKSIDKRDSKKDLLSIAFSFH